MSAQIIPFPSDRMARALPPVQCNPMSERQARTEALLQKLVAAIERAPLKEQEHSR
ncbi:hypothetical protein ACIPR8_00645 [Stenotrophomonas sp. LARHCG68]